MSVFDINHVFSHLLKSQDWDSSCPNPWCISQEFHLKSRQRETQTSSRWILACAGKIISPLQRSSYVTVQHCVRDVNEVDLFTKNHKFAAEMFLLSAGIWTSRWLESLNLCISCSKQKLQTNTCFLQENIETNRSNLLSKQSIHYRICKSLFSEDAILLASGDWAPKK